MKLDVLTYATPEEARRLAAEDIVPPDHPEAYYRAVFRGSDLPDPYIYFEIWKVVRTTPRGAWIVPKYDAENAEPEFCLKDGRKACATRGLAVRRLCARTRSYLRHARRAVADAERRYQALIGPLPDAKARLGLGLFEY